MDFCLRQAVPADHHLVLGLIREYYAFDHIRFEEPVIAPGLTMLLADPALGRVFLLVEHEIVAGYIIMTFSFDLEFGGPQATITDVYLRPEFRSRGLGTKAFLELESFGRELGLVAFELQASRENAAARAFYTKMGFRTHDRVPMFKEL